MAYIRHVTVDIECVACGHKFEVHGDVDYGRFMAFDDMDYECPECGTYNEEE